MRAWRHLSRMIVTACLLITVGGCAVTRTEVASPAELPASFSTAGVKVLPHKWWHAFGDEQLDALIEEALSGNFTLQTAWDRFAQARAVARIEGAELYPQIDGSASAAGIGQRIRSSNSKRADFDLGLFASYEVDLWGRVRSRRDAAVADAEATYEDVLAAAITLSASVAETWYALAEALQDQRVLESQIDTNQRVLELITFRFRQGSSVAADVFRQRQLVESTRGDLILAASSAQTLELRLAVLLGRPPRSPVPSDEARLIELPPLPETGIPAHLIRNRPDIRAAYLDVQAADLRVAEAVADRFPRISITMNGTTNDDNLRDLFDNWMATVAANLVQPIVDGGRRRAEVDRTRAIVSAALHVYGQTILDTLEEVENALSREAYQTAFLASLDDQLTIAQHVIDRTRDSFVRGQLEYLRVLDALTSRQALERQQVAALRGRISSRIELCRALAAGWSMEQPALAQLDGDGTTKSSGNADGADESTSLQ